MLKLSKFILCISLVGSSSITVAPTTQANSIPSSSVSNNQIINQENNSSQATTTNTTISPSSTTTSNNPSTIITPTKTIPDTSTTVSTSPSTQETTNNITVSSSQREQFCYQYFGIPSRVFPGLGLRWKVVSCE